MALFTNANAPYYNTFKQKDMSLLFTQLLNSNILLQPIDWRSSTTDDALLCKQKQLLQQKPNETLLSTFLLTVWNSSS
jgi:hypothetical protein